MTPYDTGLPATLGSLGSLRHDTGLPTTLGSLRHWAPSRRWAHSVGLSGLQVRLGLRFRSGQAFGHGELENKLRAPSDFALDTDSSTMCLDDFSSRWQTESGATIFGAVERFKHV